VDRPGTSRTRVSGAVLLPAMVVNALLVGASLDQVVKQLPARHVIGVVAFSAYSRAGDLANGVAWYASLGIGSAALALAAAAITARGRVRRSPRWALAVVAATVAHLAVTAVAAPLDFSQREHVADPVALTRIFDTFALGVALSWLNALIGLLVRDPESAGLAGILGAVPLIFTSSTFVPITTMPGWLQPFAHANPVTLTVDALRALCLGGPTATPVLYALTWIIALVAVTVPAAVIRYRTSTAA